MTMGTKDFVKTQVTLMQLGQAASKLDLKEFIEKHIVAEETDPTSAKIDPVLFRRAIPNLSAMKELAEAAMVLGEKFKKFEMGVKAASKEQRGQASGLPGT